MVSDLSKNDELKDHAGIQLGTMMTFGGNLSTKESMRKFIEDFD